MTPNHPNAVIMYNLATSVQSHRIYFCTKNSFSWYSSWQACVIIRISTLAADSSSLTHCGQDTHICVGKSTIVASDNGLSPGRRQAIIWTNAGILLIGPLGTNFSEILIGIQTFSFKKMHLKMSSAKWRPFCLGLNMLSNLGLVTPHGLIDLGNTGSANGLLLDGTVKPLPELMLTYHHSGPAVLPSERFLRKYSWYKSGRWVSKLHV